MTEKVLGFKEKDADRHIMASEDYCIRKDKLVPVVSLEQLRNEANHLAKAKYWDSKIAKDAMGDLLLAAEKEAKK